MTRHFNNMFKNKRYLIAKAIALAIFPVILLILPSGIFDKGPDICLFTILSGYHCWGCGMTRGCMHLIHLDYLKAWQYNGMCFIVLPILCGLVLADFRKTMLRLMTFYKKQTETTELPSS